MVILPEYKDLLGKPFEYGAEGPDAYDCRSLAAEMYRRAGLQFPSYKSTSSSAEQAAGYRHGAEHHYAKVEEPQALDIILFQVMPRFITHCGIYLEYGRFIHTMESIQVSVEELYSPMWEPKMRGIYRLKELA